MSEATCDSTNPIVEFPVGKVIGTRWRITKRIGNGAYGAVYEAQSLQDANLTAALKVESNDAEESILKVEVEVLKQLLNRPNTLRLLHSGKREMYSYLVMTLCGPDLTQLKNRNKLLTLSESTTLRIGIHCLFAIKQIHEVGYVHRDVKPSNMAIGATKADCRIIYLIDYGMVRRYADRRKGKWQIRAPRKRGRVDDLWSMVYMLVDLRLNSLPWGKTRREDRILYMKQKTSDKDLAEGCQLACITKILSHLRRLSYPDRPSYDTLYKLMMVPIEDKHYKFSDPFDWEKPPGTSATQSKSTASSPPSAKDASSRTARLEVSKSRPRSREHMQVNEKEFPTACASAFLEKEMDVPDISKTSYYVSTGRSTRQSANDKSNPEKTDKTSCDKTLCDKTLCSKEKLDDDVIDILP